MPVKCRTCGDKGWIVDFQDRKDCPDCVKPRGPSASCKTCGGSGFCKLEWGTSHLNVRCYICYPNGGRPVHDAVIAVLRP